MNGEEIENEVPVVWTLNGDGWLHDWRGEREQRKSGCPEAEGGSETLRKSPYLGGLWEDDACESRAECRQSDAIGIPEFVTLKFRALAPEGRQKEGNGWSGVRGHKKAGEGGGTGRAAAP